MSGAKVTDKDRGARELLRRLGKKYALKVGIFGDAAAQRAVDGHGASVGDIANAHEHGLGPPAREWFRPVMAAEEANARAGLKRAVTALAKNGEAGMVRSLNLAGLYLVGKIQTNMTAGVPPELSPNYLPRKLARYPGATTPLIASGQMRQAVGHAIEENGVEVQAPPAPPAASGGRKKPSRRKAKLDDTDRALKKLGRRLGRGLSRELRGSNDEARAKRIDRAKRRLERKVTRLRNKITRTVKRDVKSVKKALGIKTRRRRK